jgi:hypothetical protein
MELIELTPGYFVNPNAILYVKELQDSKVLSVTLGIQGEREPLRFANETAKQLLAALRKYGLIKSP